MIEDGLQAGVGFGVFSQALVGDREVDCVGGNTVNVLYRLCNSQCRLVLLHGAVKIAAAEAQFTPAVGLDRLGLARGKRFRRLLRTSRKQQQARDNEPP